MATTENEIMAMATQLAGTLTTVGIAEPNILALSASMSSLGITAERGASSVSKFFVDLSSAVSEGGEQLGLFADVAGMTSDQFSTLFRDDAMGAFESFIGGLSDINDSGGDAIATLESLGISEVRLRDTLLRLAQGHDVLTEGIELSNSAYIDGTRHLDEYNLMAGTTASQWQIAKNKFQDVAISVGQELLPVIIDLLDSSEGVIDMAKSVAEWFGNLDDNVKKNVVQFGALAVVLGPIISGLGSLAMAGGGALTFLGKLQDSIAWFTAMRGFTPGGITGGIATIGTVSGTTAGQVGVLTKALGLLASPAGIAVGSIVALYGAYKVLNSEAVKTSKAIMDFPDIDGITVDQADNLRESADELDNIARSIGNVQTAGDISFIADDVRTIGDRISELNVEKIDNLREALALLPENVQENLKQSVEDTIAGLEAQVTKAEEVVQRINELSQKDELTEGEQYEADLLSEQLINSYALANSENHQQYLQTRDYILADVEDMGQKRLRTRINHDKEYLAHIESTQQAELDSLFNLYQETAMTESEYLQNRQLIQDGYNIQRQSGIERMLRSENELYERLIDHSTTSEQREQYKQAQQAWLQEMADMYGVTVEDIQRMINRIEVDQVPEKLIDASNQTTEKLNEIARRWAQTMNGFAEETGIALEDINIDNISENLDTFITEISEAGLTWDDLLLLEKEGIISLDTLNFLQQILESEEIWEQMKLAEKEASVNVIGMEELEEIITLFGMDFTSLTDEQKQALIETRGAKELSDLLLLYGFWDKENVPAKQAVVETDNALMEFQPLLETLELWNDEDFLGKYLDVDTNALDAREKIIEFIADWKGIPVEEVKELLLETNAPQVSEDLDVATGKHEIAGGVGIAEMNTSTNADDTGRKLSNVGDTLTGLNGRSARVSVNLSDNASYTIDRISEQLRSLDGRRATTYVTSLTTQAIRHAKGTAHHPGGLAILGDGGKNEPFLTPQGLLGISPSVDTLYDLPRGSKVWPNLEKFMMNFPKYANGTQQSFLDSLQVPKGFMSSGNSRLQTQANQSRATASTVNYNVEINHPVVKEGQDIKALARQISREIGKQASNKQKGWSIQS